MALAIIFAMLPSFLFSQTLVPAMANWMLGEQIEEHKKRHDPNYRPGFFTRFQKGFEKGFLSFRESYRVILEGAVHRRVIFVIVFMGAALASFLLVPLLGRNFFPEIKGGTLQMQSEHRTAT
jgi:multidrug efflux pump subunit AcrB